MDPGYTGPILGKSCHPILLAAALMISAACGDSSRAGGIRSGVDSGAEPDGAPVAGEDAPAIAGDGGAPEDTGAEDAAPLDSGGGAADASVRDGEPTAEDAGSPLPTDGGTSSGACADLLACCSQAPATLQGICMQTVQSGNQGQCAQILTLVQSFGFCTGGDGGSPLFDGAIPFFDGAIPGFDGAIPGFDGAIPGFDGAIPGFDGAIPGFDGAIPDLDGASPDFDAALSDPDGSVAEAGASAPDA